MTCVSIGEKIGVVNCGCKGDIDTEIFRCESFDTAAHFCVVLGMAETTKEVVLLDGKKETLTYSGCNRCRFNSERLKKRAKPKEDEQPPINSGGHRWEDYATPKQIAARSAKRLRQIPE